jgi:hypothetical protein
MSLVSDSDLEKNFAKLVEHLEKVQSNFTTALKDAYVCGFKDGRDQDYLGCDVLARRESSEAKAEIDKNE